MKGILYFLMLGFFLVAKLKCTAQPMYGKDLLFKDDKKTAFEFIFNDFYSNIPSLDTCCLYAFGSAKFTILSNDRINNIQVSTRIPSFIAKQIKESIINTLYFWEIKNGYSKVEVIIPIFIAPATSCPKEKYEDAILSSAAFMFDYNSHSDSVKKSDYSKKAIATESGIIFPVLLIRGSLVK